MGDHRALRQLLSESSTMITESLDCWRMGDRERDGLEVTWGDLERLPYWRWPHGSEILSGDKKREKNKLKAKKKHGFTHTSSRFLGALHKNGADEETSNSARERFFFLTGRNHDQDHKEELL